MKYLGFEKVKSELVKLKKENEYLRYKLYLSKEAYKRLDEENEDLKRRIKYSKEPKAILNIDITPEELSKQIIKELNKNEEHKCTPECFQEHVIKAIQNDYDSHNGKYRVSLVKYWFDNLWPYYPWLESLYIIDNKIYFKSK